MTITTKYDVGDKVWMMYKNKVYHCEILAFNINSGIDGTKYALSLCDVATNKDQLHPYFTEEEIFPSKEELIASL